MPDTPNIVFVHTDQQHHQALSAYVDELKITLKP
jgi:hypothetical protein